jgi:hypothetical protein
MGLNAVEFLEMWKLVFIDAEKSALNDETVHEQCLKLASEEGLSKADLDEAAGGDVSSYLSEAVAAKS